MKIQHSSQIWEQFPQLVPIVISVAGIDSAKSVEHSVAKFHETARIRLQKNPEGEWPEIQAWRRIFSAMGLKPTQYRCASESLLRRFKTDNGLPTIHPIIDLCNAISISQGIPIAVFDADQIYGSLTVCHATGSEKYLTFGGETENPKEGEIIFVDEAQNAHARRWCNRQSKLSSIQPDTQNVLIVAEAVHQEAAAISSIVMQTLTQTIEEIWPGAKTVKKILSKQTPSFEF
jgi:DNA/RNA-binding domain of Phe-tRNA-synthetase-like protein